MGSCTELTQVALELCPDMHQRCCLAYWLLWAFVHLHMAFFHWGFITSCENKKGTLIAARADFWKVKVFLWKCGFDCNVFWWQWIGQLQVRQKTLQSELLLESVNTCTLHPIPSFHVTHRTFVLSWQLPGVFFSAERNTGGFSSKSCPWKKAKAAYVSRNCCVLFL